MSFRSVLLAFVLVAASVGCGGRVYDDGENEPAIDASSRDDVVMETTDTGVASACDACAAEKCGPALEACRSNSSCIKARACADGCVRVLSCLNNCKADFPSANYDLLLKCLASRCGC